MQNMKKVSRLLGLTLMGVVAFGLSACASTSSGTAGGGAAMEGEGVELVVINDRTPPAPITVFLIPETGGRERLGNLQPNGRQTFRYSPMAAGQEFYFVAEAVGESDTQSERFTLVNVSQLEWSTSSRTVRVRR